MQISLTQHQGLAAEPEIVIERNAERWTFYVANDWNNFVSKGWTFVTDMSNETKKEDWTNQIDKFLNATNDFVVIYDEQYIPFFGYSFFYFYDYLLFSKCDLQQSIFVTTSNQEQRVENIDTAVIACLIAVLILITTPYWSLLPLAWVANLAVIVVIVNYLFLYIVYGYQLSCAPLMPYTLDGRLEFVVSDTIGPRLLLQTVSDDGHRARRTTRVWYAQSETSGAMRISLNLTQEYQITARGVS